MATPANPTATTDTNIKCPYCAEVIAAAAKKCKHCGEFLDQLCGRHGCRLRFPSNGHGIPELLPF